MQEAIRLKDIKSQLMAELTKRQDEIEELEKILSEEKERSRNSTISLKLEVFSFIFCYYYYLYLFILKVDLFFFA